MPSLVATTYALTQKPCVSTHYVRTNFNTKENPSKYLEYLRQETIISAKNMFSAASNALSVQPSLKKVVIMMQIPRYDPAEVDPLSLKPVLSQLFNTTLTGEWMTCLQRDRIVIGNHNIECTGAIKESRYTESKTGRFDGIHLLGNSGQKAYTRSVLNILKTAQLTSPDYDYHKSCDQYRYQHGQYRRAQDHGGYSQAGRWDFRHTEKKVYRNVYNSQSGYTVPTKNRFSGLNQGNL